MPTVHQKHARFAGWLFRGYNYPHHALQVTALHPLDHIVQAASDLATDLMVISTRGYTGWQHLLFGSDAEKIV
jgi:hypothetical protein